MYLHNCKSIEELKAAYRAWTKKLHPDCGGSDAEMKALNLEYETMFERLKNQHNATAEADQQTTETAKDFIDIMEKLIHLDGIIIEVCGKWLWISGNTYPHREALKNAGCHWASKKRLWYWRSPEYAATAHKAVSMDRIRQKYGSEIHKGSAAYRPALA